MTFMSTHFPDEISWLRDGLSRRDTVSEGSLSGPVKAHGGCCRYGGLSRASILTLHSYSLDLCPPEAGGSKLKVKINIQLSQPWDAFYTVPNSSPCRFHGSLIWPSENVLFQCESAAVSVKRDFSG